MLLVVYGMAARAQEPTRVNRSGALRRPNFVDLQARRYFRWAAIICFCFGMMALREIHLREGPATKQFGSHALVATAGLNK
jgi:hypothetical protein